VGGTYLRLLSLLGLDFVLRPLVVSSDLEGWLLRDRSSRTVQVLVLLDGGDVLSLLLVLLLARLLDGSLQNRKRNASEG